MATSHPISTVGGFRSVGQCYHGWNEIVGVAGPWIERWRRRKMFIQSSCFTEWYFHILSDFDLFFGWDVLEIDKDIIKICIGHVSAIHMWLVWRSTAIGFAYPGDRLCEEQLQGGDFQGGGRIQRFMRNLHVFFVSLSSWLVVILNIKMC